MCRITTAAWMSTALRNNYKGQEPCEFSRTGFIVKPIGVWVRELEFDPC